MHSKEGGGGRGGGGGGSIYTGPIWRSLTMMISVMHKFKFHSYTVFGQEPSSIKEKEL